MSWILQQIKETCHTKNNSSRSMDVERFQKLIEWVDYNESHLSILQQAWNNESFWPFLSTSEATEQVGTDINMLIRLSNSRPGAITVTRAAKSVHSQMTHIVKHKRYLPSAQHGKVTLAGSWGFREVTWDGLIQHLVQKV